MGAEARHVTALSVGQLFQAQWAVAMQAMVARTAGLSCHPAP